MATEVFKEISVGCAKKGVSISEMCRKLGISRDKVQRWKSKEPTSVTDYKKIKNYLNAIQEKNEDNNSARNS